MSDQPSLELTLEHAHYDNAPVRLPRPHTTPLSEDEARRLVAGIKETLPRSESDAPHIRPGPEPPPLTGARVEASFPCEDAPPAASEDEPIEVVRVSPEGEIPVGTRVTITFTRGVAALGAEPTDEAQLVPQPPGRWRWLGTRTLVFEPELERLPGSTSFAVNVASHLGGSHHTFETGPARLLTSLPHRDVAAESKPTIVAVFDQAVDATALAERAYIQCGTKKILLVPRENNLAELSLTEPGMARALEGALTQRWATFEPATPLPADTTATVVFPRGTPSAEGPIRTREDQKHEFRVAGLFEVTKHECGWSGRCEPRNPWTFTFTNDVNIDDFDLEQVVTDPPVEFASFNGWGKNLSLIPLSKGSTQYSVTLPESLSDAFDQPLRGTRTFSFSVGPDSPSLTAGLGVLSTIHADASRVVRMHTINVPELRVQLYDVSIEEWKTYMSWRNRSRREPPLVPGRLVEEWMVDTEGSDDQLQVVPIDLERHIPRGECGHWVLSVDVKPSLWQRLTRSDYPSSTVRTWIQTTRLAGTVSIDKDTVHAWANDLDTGAPRAGVLVSAHNLTAVTDAAGLARIQGFQQSAQFVFSSDDDTAFVIQRYGSFRGTRRPERRFWHVFDDRGMYKPGESVRLKGWLRNESGALGQDREVPSGKMICKITDATGNDILKKPLTLDDHGGFAVEFALPDTPALGTATATLKHAGSEHRHHFEIQEFRRPEYEVTVVSRATTSFIDDPVPFEATASYYSGEPLPESPADWSVRVETTSYRPPGWQGWTFGLEPQRWFWWTIDDSESTSATIDGRTDSNGTDEIAARVSNTSAPRTFRVTADASITDINRQRWSSSASSLVHPSALYVGIRGPNLIQVGEAFSVEIVVADLDGISVTRRVDMSLERDITRFHKGKYVTEWHTLESFVVDVDGPTPAEFTPDQPGQYRIVSRTADDRDRVNQTTIYSYAVAPGQTSPGVDAQSLRIIPNAESLATGDTLELAVASGGIRGHGLVTVRSHRTLEEHSIVVDGDLVVRLDIKPSWTPRVTIDIEISGERDGQPAWGCGDVELDISRDHVELDVAIALESDALEPGGATTCYVDVTQAGAPAPEVSVALWVVDEAVLALSGYDTPDPLAAFYPASVGYVTTARTRETLLSMDDPFEDVEAEVVLGAFGGAELSRGAGGMVMAPAAMAMAMPQSAPGGMPPEAGPTIALRTNFDALAFYRGDLTTDARGRVTCQVKLPDNLTRYRVIANAVTHECAGAADTSLKARLPLTVRPSPPRFANVGDRFEFPVVVHNAASTPANVRVALRTYDLALEHGDVDGKTIQLEAGQRAEVRFPAAAERTGRVHFDVIARSDGAADAARNDFPIYTPATSVAFATYGEIDGDGVVTQPIERPHGVYPTFGGLEVSWSSTALQALTDAVVQLAIYAFDCAEQRASRMIGCLTVAPVLEAFAVDDMPDADTIDATITRDLDHLKRLQKRDGGWGFWSEGNAWPAATIHVVHALILARDAGYPVSTELNAGLNYLEAIESHLSALLYSKASRVVLKAWAGAVLNHAGRDGSALARTVLKENKLADLPTEVIAHLLTTLGNPPKHGLLNELLNRSSFTERLCVFQTSIREDQGHIALSSSRRTDALALNALIDTDPTSAMIAATVRGLIAHRKRGHWGSTQENSQVLLALYRYFTTYEAHEPDFVARGWLGQGFAGEHTFQGRTTETAAVNVPMTELLARDGDVVLAKTGPGRLYWRIGIRSVPATLALPAEDRGFVVERTYQAVDDDSDVQRIDDGTWVVRAGAKIRVRVTFSAPIRRHHVALVDPIPAGFEILNPALAVTAPVADKQPRQWANQIWAVRGPRGPMFVWEWWKCTWYEHQNLRDERAEAFSSLLRAGVHHYVYTCRATTPGTFAVGPAKAEEMYAPEVFGRSACDRVRIVDIG